MSQSPPETGRDEAAASPLVDALARHARARAQAELDARPEGWEAALRGERALEEVAAERRDAGDDPATVARAQAYFEPFHAEETRSLVDAVLVAQGAAGDEAPLRADAPTGSSTVSEVSAPTATSPASLRAVEAPAADTGERPSSPSEGSNTVARWWIPGGMVLAAAAAILIWWLWPPSQGVRGGDDVVASVELPAYRLETDGGLRSLRGDTGSETGEVEVLHRYRREDRLEWVLRPQVDVDATVAVRAFVFADADSQGLALALDDMIDVADSGSIRIAGPVSELKLEPGRYVVALVVAADGELPERADQLDDSADASGPWQVLRLTLSIED